MRHSSVVTVETVSHFHVMVRRMILLHGHYHVALDGTEGTDVNIVASATHARSSTLAERAAPIRRFHRRDDGFLIRKVPYTLIRDGGLFVPGTLAKLGAITRRSQRV